MPDPGPHDSGLYNGYETMTYDLIAYHNEQVSVIDVPARSLILAILRVAIFSIEVPERERVKRRAVCNLGCRLDCILLFAYLSLSLSLWHRSAENGNPKNCQN